MKKNILISFACTCCALFVLFGSNAHAGSTPVDRYVATTGDDTGNDCTSSAAPCATITYALTQSESGDTMYLAAGRYRETDLHLWFNLSIVGNDAADTIIDADTDSDGVGDGQIMLVDNGFTASLSKITFTNGLTAIDSGGAINCTASSTLNISDCVFTDNESSNQYGGAIYSSCTTTITDSTFSGNVSGAGGAIHIDTGATANISRCAITGNRATDDYGGAILSDGTLTITDTTIHDNESPAARGGGIQANGSTTMRRCTVSNNRSAGTGGGIKVENGGTTHIINSTISGNEADGSGGGLHLGSATVNVHNVTITGNIADKDGGGGDDGGGGIYVPDIAGTTLTIENSIVAGNMLGAAADDCFKGTAGTLTSNGYNILAAASATCDPSFGGSDKLGENVATVIDPLLLDNGGLTRTHAPVEGSPAIDAATPVADGGCQDHTAAALTVDQRNMTRPVNARCDIGAVELGSCGDSVVDFNEACDDGNDDNTDDCLDTCASAACGDGSVQAGVEGCDDGNTMDGDGCAADCTAEVADDAGTTDAAATSSSGGCSMIPHATATASAFAPLILLAGLAFIRRRKRG